MILSAGPVLKVPMADLHAQPAAPSAARKIETMEEVERRHILETLDTTDCGQRAQRRGRRAGIETQHAAGAHGESAAPVPPPARGRVDRRQTKRGIMDSVVLWRMDAARVLRELAWRS